VTRSPSEVTGDLLNEAKLLEVEAARRSWRPYTEYQETGVDWLERLPAHWRLQKLKHAARIQFSNVDKKFEDGEQPVRLCNYVDVYYHDRITSDIEFMDATALSREISKFQLLPGDVLVTKDSEDPHDICVPAVVAEDLPGVLCGYHLAQIRPFPDDTHGPYLSYALASSGIRDQFRMRANGITRFGLSQDDVCSSLVPLPPLPEQRAIAAFLDRKTRQIDELIKKKRRLIELLQEKRTAQISHTVTKGLKPDAPMKPSGVDWLGDVPAHWEVWKITHGFRRLSSGTTPKSDDLSYYDGDIPWVTTSELRETVIHDTAAKLTPHALTDYSSLRLYPPGTLLFAMYGATIGRMGLLGITATVNQACAAFVDPIHLDAQFTYYWLQMRRSTLIALSAGGGQPNLSQDDLRQIRIPAPSIDEQRHIVEFLDATLERYALLEARIGEAIEELYEYRQALISAAVTGQIDVREEVDA